MITEAQCLAAQTLGYEASKSGEPVSANPYPQPGGCKSLLHEAWRDGWLDATEDELNSMEVRFSVDR